MAPNLEEYYFNILNTASSTQCAEDTDIPDDLLKFSIKKSNESSGTIKTPSISEISTLSPKNANSDSSPTKNKAYKLTKTIFGEIETTVYMMLFEDICQCRTSGTQATASVNKCLQVTPILQKKISLPCNKICSSSTCAVASSISRSLDYSSYALSDSFRNPDIYLFGRKKQSVVKSESSGMGHSDEKYENTKSKNWPKKLFKYPSKNSTSTQAKSISITTGAQTKKHGGNRGVIIKEEKQPCPNAISGLKDMSATISHIRIGPKEPCPFYGTQPCQGPKCILATTGSEDKGHVKVTNSTNPRRGVFELVIRRINGAPLARNELMLEWTPPITRHTCQFPCIAPCPVPVRASCCRPSKCKIVCRATTCRPSSYWRKACKAPCRRASSKKTPCKRCCKTISSGNPSQICNVYHPCVPCPPPRNKRCSSTRCKPCLPSPCVTSPCGSCTSSRKRACFVPSCSRQSRLCSPPRCRLCSPPRCITCSPPPCPPYPTKSCKPCTLCCVSPCPLSSCSSPCLRPCPVAYRKLRRARSQPRPRRHRKLTSPCLNRSKTCPVVRCRSVPGPYLKCGSTLVCPPSKCCFPFPSPPRKCYSVFPCRRRCSTLLCPPRKYNLEFVCPPPKHCCV